MIHPLVALTAWWLSAGSVGIELTWDAPDTCRPAQRVNDQLTTSSLDPDGEPAVHVVVRGAGRAWTADVEIATDVGPVRRSLGEADCDALADAIAVVIIVTLDPFANANRDASDDAPLVPEMIIEPENGTANPPEPSEERPAQPPAQPSRGPRPSEGVEPLSAAPPDREPPLLRQRGVRWDGLGAWLGGGGEVGLFPLFFGSASGGLSLRFGALRVDLSGIFVGTRRIEHPEGGAAAVNLGAAQVRGCWVPGWARVEVPLCAGAEAGALTARGRGLVTQGTARAPWAGALISARVLGNVGGRWWIWGGPEGVLSLLRPGFTIDDFAAPIAVASPGSFRFAAGVEVRFP